MNKKKEILCNIIVLGDKDSRKTRFIKKYIFAHDFLFLIYIKRIIMEN